MAYMNLNVPERLLTHWGRDKMVDTLADNIFKHIFLDENVGITIQTSLQFVS